MKTKKTINKLGLNKETVANLENHEMNAVQGGTDLTAASCYVHFLSKCICKDPVSNSCACPQTM